MYFLQLVLMLYFGAMVLPLCKKIITFAQSERSNGGIGRHEGLKIPWPLRLCGFKSRFEYGERLLILLNCQAFFVCLSYIFVTLCSFSDNNMLQL